MIASTACSSRRMFSALSSRASAAASCAATSASSLRCARISCAERADQRLGEVPDLPARRASRIERPTSAPAASSSPSQIAARLASSAWRGWSVRAPCAIARPEAAGRLRVLAGHHRGEPEDHAAEEQRRRPPSGGTAAAVMRAISRTAGRPRSPGSGRRLHQQLGGLRGIDRRDARPAAAISAGKRVARPARAQRRDAEHERALRAHAPGLR